MLGHICNNDRLQTVNLNRKSQIGTFMTWFVAYIIIFVMLLLFIAFATTLRVATAVATVDFVSTSVKIINGVSGNFELENSLFFVLERGIGDFNVRERLVHLGGMSGQDRAGSKAELENGLKNILGQFKQCYMFYADGEDKILVSDIDFAKNNFKDILGKSSSTRAGEFKVYFYKGECGK